MPSVRRIAEEAGADPSRVAGTGKDGRVTKGDMLAALEAQRRVARREACARTRPGRPAPQRARARSA